MKLRGQLARQLGLAAGLRTDNGHPYRKPRPRGRNEPIPSWPAAPGVGSAGKPDTPALRHRPAKTPSPNSGPWRHHGSLSRTADPRAPGRQCASRPPRLRRLGRIRGILRCVVNFHPGKVSRSHCARTSPGRVSAGREHTTTCNSVTRARVEPRAETMTRQSRIEPKPMGQDSIRRRTGQPHAGQA
jgi:hypothetical protein